MWAMVGGRWMGFSCSPELHRGNGHPYAVLLRDKPGGNVQGSCTCSLLCLSWVWLKVCAAFRGYLREELRGDLREELRGELTEELRGDLRGTSRMGPVA